MAVYYVYSSVLLLAPLLIFFVSKCERKRERKESASVCSGRMGSVHLCVSLPACAAGLRTFSRLRIYLFILYICLMCVKPRQRRRRKNVLHNRTFSTPFSESPTNGQTSRKRVGNGLEDFSFYRRVASFFGFEFDWI